MPVVDSEDSAGRWSIDHLFLDQDAVPTFVETKRSSDGRLRREVIAQILEYAANGVVHWSPGKIQAEFEITCRAMQKDPAEVITTFLDADANDMDDSAVDAFWERAERNLAEERLRLILVADRIPTETLRIIEFLNNQMDPVEFLAVEVKQFVGDGHRTLVPRLLGQTAKAMQKRSRVPRESREWSEEEVFEQITQNAGPDSARLARELIDWIRPQVAEVRAEGTIGRCGLEAGLLLEGKYTRLLIVDGKGKFALDYKTLEARTAFHDPVLLSELKGRFAQIPSVDKAKAIGQKWLMLPASILAEPSAMSGFRSFCEWVISTVRSAAHS
jgi:hypothetical protein